MKKIASVALAAALVMTLAGGKAIAADAKNGESIAKQCLACHDLSDKKQNKVGPYLSGIVGQPAGKVAGYKYSQAHLDKAAGITWDEATLDKYLTNPRDFIPGNKMAYAGLKKDSDRADLIEYMKGLK